jgi:hypothetical protein
MAHETRVAALEAETAASAAAAAAATSALAEARADADAFKAKARSMLEEKDKELETVSARLARVLRDEETTSVDVGDDGVGDDGDATPGRTPEEEATTSEATTSTATPAAVAAPPNASAALVGASPASTETSLDASRLDYLRNVISKFLVTDDWETQDRLVPVIGAVLGFSESDLASVKTKRDALTPLDIRAARLIG